MIHNDKQDFIQPIVVPILIFGRNNRQVQAQVQVDEVEDVPVLEPVVLEPVVLEPVVLDEMPELMSFDEPVQRLATGDIINVDLLKRITGHDLAIADSTLDQ